MSLPKRKSKGFTLIELLVVISILVVLSVAVYVALDPAGRLTDARNSRRTSAVNNYLTAIHECIVDNDGVTSACLGSLTAGDVYEIVDTGTASGCDDVCSTATSDTHCAALDSNLANYLADLPEDPSGVATGHTEYSVSVSAAGMVTVTACAAEGGAVVQVSR